ncbi:decarboxylating NADP(+)-dependent phosphogluconate dehydrogenase [Pseudaquabacterium pictum]|uniref:6-phosphogluconate dehydrogenase, decarboxylating n=1 Tax=Pseudaquabacterium pictum TaxID=2315236 RepID=A0A480AKA7_9BURK|nr:decarboxylating NADP(+)-dependent phosphogluconate dehydrogenase [Rubrivivax pictus]GCL62169.1 6-phosphogluconate dehydrogenase, decarboxylating [Rubrivivax pictus]
MTAAPSDFGLIGLAVMGQNLVLNVESRGFAVSVYNRTPAATEAFVAAHPGKRITGHASLTAFVQSLSRPRRVMLMVKAGAAVDAVIEQLIPLLEQDDIIIDGGNSLYTDTERRDAWLTPLGLRFIGAGVSGGEEGARKGPSIMPGGPASTWAAMRPVFEAIAAQVDGQPCVVHIGPGGAGHYVKMIHNGIEYGDMQLICEAYALLQAAGLSNARMAAVFDQWNQGELQSYLIQITARALEQVDAETGRHVVDLILDKAGQKGTGQWTQLNAAENAVVISTINAAVEARVLSSQKDQRVAASGQLQGPAGRLEVDAERLITQVHDALFASKIVSYAQGLDLMRTMGAKKGWGLDLGAIAGIWRGGCIIRAQFLRHITAAYQADPGLQNLMLAPYFQTVLNRSQAAWRQVVAQAVSAGIPVPAFGASLAYFDSLRSARLPANLLQAQRDFFGAHTYERIDKPAGQWFHTAWPEVIG